MALTVDVLGASAPVGALCALTGRPHPLWTGVLVGLVWSSTGALRRRYAADVLGESGAVLPVVRDWLVMLGVLAAVCVTVRAEVSVAAWVPALLPCLVLTAVHRKVMFRHTLSLRRDARGLRRVLVVGEPEAVGDLLARMGTRTDGPYVVVGSCVIGDGDTVPAPPTTARLPLDGGVGGDRVDDDGAGTVLRCAAGLDADLVLVVPGAAMSGERLRRLAWALHDDGRDLAVVPGLIEVARHRLRPAEAAGMTVLHVDPAPRRGLPMLLKRATDTVGALLLTVLLAPLLAAVAVAVRLSSPGPALYRQVRVGRNGTTFRMWKFRTMVAAADRMRPELETANEHDGAMFKMRRDPRVTRLGRFLRRSSLDELPQLYNVLVGHMSLVGPRPPLPEEVERYDTTELRRLSVRPGLTGVWQVGGRSDLSWEETVALDLNYVDNWSYARDIDVLARTLRAVVSGRGAY
ncbi:exopolysaccharide biosynthesis polyprenyl glycosylphosphotransferase [Streptomyces megasporus]|uniref:exopolysaccharide biosynthesis polyprenyl glycosylphosphotransferase n=1 Tax=Streptomyces megasporus TaxID=44060 RepID=UPI000AD7E7C7|nr:exopolysaccharide biosynthesis polyprenyl glycosylphosphotransferase [Streptomyces megasporus]